MSNEQGVPQAGIYKLATRQCERAAGWGNHEPWDELHPATRDSYIRSAREDLEAVLPSIRDQVLGEVLSDRAVEAAAIQPSLNAGSEDASYWHQLDDEEKSILRDEARSMLEAALATLTPSEDTTEEADETPRWLEVEKTEPSRSQGDGVKKNADSFNSEPAPSKAGDEELTMIALALKNQGIEDCTPEQGVEKLIGWYISAEAYGKRDRALLEALTEICPVCEGDDSGGGIDEPAYSCDHCKSRTRIPAEESSGDQEKVKALADREPGVMAREKGFEQPWAGMEERWATVCDAQRKLEDLAVEAVEDYANLPADQRMVKKARHEALREAAGIVAVALRGGTDGDVSTPA